MDLDVARTLQDTLLSALRYYEQNFFEGVVTALAIGGLLEILDRLTEGHALLHILFKFTQYALAAIIAILLFRYINQVVSRLSSVPVQ